MHTTDAWRIGCTTSPHAHAGDGQVADRMVLGSGPHLLNRSTRVGLGEADTVVCSASQKRWGHAL